MKCKLYNDDCIKIMNEIDEKPDLILTDPPYGCTNYNWDQKLDIMSMWFAIERITKETTPVCLFSQNPFTSELIQSNLKRFRYEWIWEKNEHTNPFLVSQRPLRNFEYVLIFSDAKTKYHPPLHIKRNRKQRQKLKRKLKRSNTKKEYFQNTLVEKKVGDNIDLDFVYQDSFLRDFSFRKGEKINFREAGIESITQKPISLLEFLIETYTEKNDLVLDFTCGTGSTAVACINLERRFIGIEKNKDFFNFAKKRVKEARDRVKEEKKQTKLEVKI